MIDKKKIEWFKQKFPACFSMVVQSTVLVRLLLELDRWRYVGCLLMKQPYFGSICLAGQTWEIRKKWMQQLISIETQTSRNKKVLFLEIGSWTGNSAVTWADYLREKGIDFYLVCVDDWQPYMIQRDFDQINVAPQLMNEYLRQGKIFKLFLHNIKCAGYEKNIKPLKGRSDEILPLLKDATFDIAYIDGDHRYSQLMKDLSRTAELVKMGGVICGDDLDLTIQDVDQRHAKEKAEWNVTVDPILQKVYHPGVTMAIHDFFKIPVKSYDGFWAVRKTSKGWENIHF